MFCDFHTHILPGIDDGARNLEMSLGMLGMMKRQGVDKAVATPHFYAHQQPMKEFVQKREAALTEIRNSGADGLPEIHIGAEVYLERDMRRADLRPLCLQGTPFILIEMPYMPYDSWMLEEVYDFCIKQSLQPIFAHIDRYFSLYGDSDVQEILDFDNAVIQVNNSALFSRKNLKMVTRWIQEGRTIVFGSDCHNVSDREPNDGRAQSVLKAKLGKTWSAEYDALIAGILGNSPAAL